MRKLHLGIIAIAIPLLFSACATKRYPIATPMSAREASLMTCKDLSLELVRAEEIENKINDTGEFDGKTVLGFLGDFGVGNAMAKSEAREALNKRKKAIQDEQIRKGCK